MSGIWVDMSGIGSSVLVQEVWCRYNRTLTPLLPPGFLKRTLGPFFTSFPCYSTTTMMVGQKNPGSNFLVEFAFVARVVALKSL